MKKWKKYCRLGIYKARYNSSYLFYLELERVNCKGLKFHMNNFSCFEINVSLF